MANKVREGWACSVCGKVYSDAPHADSCRDSHELLYVPMSKTELNRLINAIVLENFSLVPFELLERFRKYARKSLIDEQKGV